MHHPDANRAAGMMFDVFFVIGSEATKQSSISERIWSGLLVASLLAMTNALFDM